MNHIEIANEIAGVPTRPQGVSVFYPYPDALTCAQGEAAFLADADKENKILPAMPGTNEPRACVVAAAPTLFYVGRNFSGSSATSSISVLLNGVAGLTYRSRLIPTGNTPALPADFATRALIADGGPFTRAGLVPAGAPARYGSLHANTPNGTYVLQLLRADNTVLQSANLDVTNSGPELAFAAVAQSPDPPDTGTSGTTPSPTPTPSNVTYTGITPLMDMIRFRFRATANQIDVAFTGSGDWQYKVARTSEVNNVQQVPNWSAIGWLDCPGGTGERVLTLPGHPQANRTVQVILQSKTRPEERYDVPIICNGGSTNGYDYIVLARPSAGIIDMRVFTILPFRTWSDDLIVSRENGPTADTVRVRVKSGFPRAANTRWFWWFCGVPYEGFADQDDFTITVAKGVFFEVYRYVCPTTAFVRYNQNDPNSAGETLATTQKWGDMYVNDNLLSNDAVRLWTGTN